MSWFVENNLFHPILQTIQFVVAKISIQSQVQSISETCKNKNVGQDWRSGEGAEHELIISIQYIPNIMEDWFTDVYTEQANWASLQISFPLLFASSGRLYLFHFN